MTIPVHQPPPWAGTPATRADVMRVLQQVGSPDQLDVRGQDLRGIDLANCDLRGASLAQARVDQANLCGTLLARADLHGATLRGSYLCWAELRGADLREADLRGADLNWADLREADLRGADLEGAILSGASLRRAELGGITLEGADVRGADLSWASFDAASASAQAKDQLELRGAIFHEVPPATAVVPFSKQASPFALGFVLGLLSMSAISFLGVVRLQSLRTSLRLKRQTGDHAPGLRRAAPRGAP